MFRNREQFIKIVVWVVELPRANSTLNSPSIATLFPRSAMSLMPTVASNPGSQNEASELWDRPIGAEMCGNTAWTG